MIIIGTPYIEQEQETVKLIYDVKIDDNIHKFFISVDSVYEPYLVTDRCDGMLCGILHYAMKNHHDITCDAPITEELLYKIQEQLIPSLK